MATPSTQKSESWLAPARRFLPSVQLALLAHDPRWGEMGGLVPGALNRPRDGKLVIEWVLVPQQVLWLAVGPTGPGQLRVAWGLVSGRARLDPAFRERCARLGASARKQSLEIGGRLYVFCPGDRYSLETEERVALGELLKKSTARRVLSGLTSFFEAISRVGPVLSEPAKVDSASKSRLRVPTALLPAAKSSRRAPGDGAARPDRAFQGAERAERAERVQAKSPLRSSRVAASSEGKPRGRARSAQVPGERLFGKYEVLEQLPSGAMSDCFKVRCDDDGKIYFLKVAHGSSVAARALERELGVYSRLATTKGRNLLRLRGVERDAQHLALVTEFAAGGTLGAHVRARGPLSPAEAKAVGLQVLAGLRELHALDIVHRDLKPDNVLRTRTGWKLTDFGISKNLAKLFTHTALTFQGAGTPGFAPPEQWDKTAAHPSADIYAFGKLLAFLLTADTDVDKVEPTGWRKFAKWCTEEVADARPTLDEVEAGLRRR